MPRDDARNEAGPSLEYSQLDELLHSRIRLAVTAALAGVDEADFSWLRDVVGASDGNLASHLRKLEDAKYVLMRKTFVGRKPVTYYALSAHGRQAFTAYVRALSKFTGGR
ncbi:MAG: transcriptional regulator [Spirochaetia bacterium]|nr:transcriptional regulator [Spirochaetia bacterium]